MFTSHILFSFILLVCLSKQKKIFLLKKINYIYKSSIKIVIKNLENMHLEKKIKVEYRMELELSKTTRCPKTKDSHLG